MFEKGYAQCPTCGKITHLREEHLNNHNSTCYARLIAPPQCRQCPVEVDLPRDNCPEHGGEPRDEAKHAERMAKIGQQIQEEEDWYRGEKAPAPGERPKSPTPLDLLDGD
ncbi:MAG: hypothetical protein AAB649_07295 [Patescibacteria group bacterium]